MSDVKLVFTKPALSVNEHIKLLRERGLIIDDDLKAAHYLTFLGYYRLSGYFRFFRDGKSENLRAGTSFNDVLDLYVFDRKLRVLLTDALERIEVATKATLSDVGAATDGPFWMCNPINFDRGAHQSVLDEIKKALGPDPQKNHHLFISHFFSSYSNPIPPCWMLMETLSFSASSRIYKVTKGTIRKDMSASFKLQQDILESWLHSLVFVRNLCAHNSRVWNRKITIKPKIPKQYQTVIPQESQATLYVVCCVLQHLMAVIADGSQWAERLKSLISERPSVMLHTMGFPEGWEGLPPWRELSSGA